MITKKIALFGTDPRLAEQVAAEALVRGHSVTLVVPNPQDINLKYHSLKSVQGNMMDVNDVSKHAAGHDVVICLHEPDIYHLKKHIKANKSVIEGAKNAGVQRIISLGHPISISADKNKAFYDMWKAVAEVQGETLKLFKNENWLRWEYLHSNVPSIQQGRSHVHRAVLVSNPEGTNKAVHAHQFIKALLEEAEKTEFIWHEDEIVF
jgi:putative NADH-flavin reductase